jgi:hypothetical protein
MDKVQESSNPQFYAPSCIEYKSKGCLGRAIAQALVAGFPPRRPGSVHVGFVVDKVPLGQVFSVLRFSLPIVSPPTAPHSSSSIIRGWYNGPDSGRRTKWTQSHHTPRN